MHPGIELNRITVFSTDIPYPPNRGGRADIWRRLLAFQQLNVSVQLIGFYDDIPGREPTASDRAAIERVVDELQLYPIRSSWGAYFRSLCRIGQQPWHVARRALPRATQEIVYNSVRSFGSDCLWLEGPWCGDLVLAVRSRLRLPLIYRSHNIEHQYMAKQAAAARRVRDVVAWRVACLGIRRFEQKMILGADWVFDISSDDLLYWQSQGVRHSSWLPPLAESALDTEKLAATDAAPPPTLDVVFLGNLATPNNVRGVEWLIEEVRPRVLVKRPTTHFYVFGSNPSEHVRALCSATGVTLQANVPDAVDLYRQARVLVNPVRTGSGTHVKAIEMLMMRAPIVTSVQGTCGLPPEVKQLFRVGETADSFAAHVLDALAQPQDCWAERTQARQLFGLEGLRQALTRMRADGAPQPKAAPRPLPAGR